MSNNDHPEYNDEYPSCRRTYSTLRVLSDAHVPDEVTALLKFEPTRAFRKGEPHAQGRLQRKTNGWFYSTKGLSDSRDTRRHIDMILTALDGRKDAIEQLQARGCLIDITSFWESSSGDGGPWLMPYQMRKLGELGIEVWWDVYFGNEPSDSAGYNAL